ncbi:MULTISPECIES: ATP-binding cassette domain-containing protein [unclassified Beijerinckia]|uniref:branched-chain amino acid ABC transporter ATP-binding protein/permease n=1 Tax=unclassified Beijerinckia TaxID=2638183 RepID=UPI000897D841|nr:MULTISPECIES: ATP-binding cassette domain-containing protein [unclassified Beijerinckia]MDH7799011.1 branched-chain amino acid transport system permease protein [Beijerinckia sp. GAS462]SED84439.1 ABC-type branched-chain amino acid transport system, ATPase component [Beijerinckia sp. 28-YEA-48]
MSLRIPVIAALCIFAAILPYLGILPGWTPALATISAFMALSLIGLNLVFGITGMLAFGQAAFVALPGYFSGMLQNLGVPFILALAIGLATSVLIARLMAIIFVRLPGIYFAIGTLGFAFVIEGLARAWPSLTGGASGLVLEMPFTLTRNGWYATSVIALTIAVASFAHLVRGRFLRTMKLVRHDELAASVIGIDVVRLKTQVFTIASVYSGLGGLLLAYHVGVLAPESAGVNTSLESLAMIVIGGAGSVFGPLLGTGLIQWLFAVSGEADRYELLVYGLGFLLVVLYLPTGLAGGLNKLWALLAPLSQRTTTTASVDPASIHPPARHFTDGVCLKVEQVGKTFGGLQAVNDISFDVRFGQIVALIGPNGAGKSTLFNLVSGIELPTAGRIFLRDREMDEMPIYERGRYIGRSFQVPRLAPNLSVIENIMSRLDHLPGTMTEIEKENLARAQLVAFDLQNLADLPMSRIGIGQHKLIELARASIGSPDLLLLDEPAVGFTETEVERLIELLRMLRAQGQAILIVEHNVEFVSRIADEIVVMESGRLIARDAPTAIMASAIVREAYLGALS